MSTREITIDEFSNLFGEYPNNMPKTSINMLDRVNSYFHFAVKEELAEYILNYQKLLQRPELDRNVSQNHDAWVEGWKENLKLSMHDGISTNSLRPKYFRGNKFLLYKGDLIVTDNLQLEYELFTVARDYLFRKYLSNFETIVEIGSGSGQNLLMLTKIFPDKKIIGYDWVKPSEEIANMIGTSQGTDVKGGIFNMLEPEKNFTLPEKSALITIHAMEQIGKKFKKFIDSLLKAKPSLVLHYEPILEFYDEFKLLDYMSLIYSKKRKYLSGYFSELKKLEEAGKIEIIKAFRPYLGGVLHESSLIIWKPIY